MCTEYIMEMFFTTRCVVLVPWVPISKVGVKVLGDAWIFSELSDRKKTLSLGILGQWNYALSIPPFLMRERFSLLYCTANMPSMSLQGVTVSILQGMFTGQMSWKLSVGWSVVRVSAYQVHRNVWNCRVISQGGTLPLLTATYFWFYPYSLSSTRTINSSH